jgi:glycerophosphoryl diester phosphodiesterase
VIELRRPPGQFARVGHRGASAHAPDNMLGPLELAVELGCDMLEFDVLPVHDGTLVLAHSRRELTPVPATLDDALALAAERFANVGLQLDLKSRAVKRKSWRHCGVTESSSAPGSADSTRVRCDGWRSSSRSSRARTSCRAIVLGSRSAVRSRGRVDRPCRCACPRCSGARATALTLHCALASSTAIRRAHDLDAAVYVWTVDDPRVAQRLIAAEADGIITNDPRILRV